MNAKGNMPFLKCQIGYRYKHYFVTGGPLNENHKQEDFIALVRDYFGTKLAHVGASKEVSAEGYKHVHIMITLTDREVWKFSAMLANKIKKYIDRFPRSSGELRRTNVRFDHPKTGETDPQQVMRKYLTIPSKDKDVGELIEFDELDELRKKVMQEREERAARKLAKLTKRANKLGITPHELEVYDRVAQESELFARRREEWLKRPIGARTSNEMPMFLRVGQEPKWQPWQY